MKYYLLLLLFLFHCSAGWANWQRSITNYPRRTYKAANQNWNVAQHENGWVYFANNNGLLEFDGESWNTYPIHNAKVRGVRPGNDGRIYAGGLGQFGYFVSNRTGGLDYVCLSDTLDRQTVGNIWDIHIADNRVYFRSDNCVFYLENEQIVRIPAIGITYSAIIYDKFYIAASGGLSILNGDGFRLLPGTEAVTRTKVVGLLPYNDKILAVSSRDGLFVYDGSSSTRYAGEADSFLRSNQLFCSAMKDSILALGSVQNGVLLLNMRNDETEKISTTNGLQNKTVLSLLFDKDNNLWLGLDNGIDCVHLNAPKFYLYSHKTEIGSGYASSYYRGKLYLGTNQGLYITEYPISINKETKLDLVPGTEGQIWSLSEYDGKLFCGGADALILVDGNRVSQLKGIRGVWSVVPMVHQPDVLIAGTYKGLYVLKKVNGEWLVSDRIKEADYSAKTMFAERMSNAIWVANKEGGLFRLMISDDLKRADAKNFNSEILPPGDNVYVSRINDEIVIASRQGLFRYNQTKDCLEPDVRLEDSLDGKTAYAYLSQDKFGNIWYVTDGMLKLVRYDKTIGSYSKNDNESYLKGLLIKDFEHLRVFDENQALVGTEEGFSLLQFSKSTFKKYPLNLQIRKVYFTGSKDSLVYGRSITYNAKPLVISYANNSLKIEYSVNNYDKSLDALYSYRLSGSENENWSEYVESNTKEYTRLKEGTYTFTVRSVVSGVNPPVTASFHFEILPPWYRTWQAYLLYTLLSTFLLFYAYYRLSKTQKEVIRRKEQEITHQQVEFKKESELKDQKIVSLKEKNLQVELKYKSDELVRTTLNIVRKNEMLQEIKNEAVHISRSVNEDSLPHIRRNLLRFISHIDANIAHDNDLKNFQASFDSVHQDFFKKLDEGFPSLNKKEKLLCAYIRMELLSKEIAPLMNISLRGIEIGRYRLRKKLLLSSEDNLAEFLQKL